MQSPLGALSAGKRAPKRMSAARWGRGEAKVRYPGACFAWEGGNAQAAGTPLFLVLPQAVSRQRKPSRTESGVWGQGEGGVTHLLKAESLVGVRFPDL